VDCCEGAAVCDVGHYDFDLVLYALTHCHYFLFREGGLGKPLIEKSVERYRLIRYVIM
jgi:hypothetical protein